MPSLLIHTLYLLLVVHVEGGPLHLQGVGQFAALHAERLGQQGEAFHLFIVGKLLLSGLYTGTEQGLHLLVLQQLGHAAIGNALLLGIGLHDGIGGHERAETNLRWSAMMAIWSM